MGSFEKPQAGQEVKEIKEIKKHEIEAYVPDKEHMKRHDMQDKKDHELSAMLQSNWAKRVEIEHRANH